MTAARALLRTRVFDALGWTFSVSSDDGRLVEYVELLYAGLTEGVPTSAHDYRIDAVGLDEHILTLDGERLGTDDDPSTLVAMIVHDVNRHAIDTTPLLAVHAGGVVGADGAVVLPAHMEGGKTTLTAGLVRAGFGYLSDEAVAFDWDTFDIRAYAKPLSIDPGSWELFPQLEPQAPFESGGLQGQPVAGAAGRGPRQGASSQRRRPATSCFPATRPVPTRELEPMSRADAVVELAKNTFHFRTHGRRGLDALARLVASLDCFRLDVGALDDAVGAISDLAGVRT